MMAIISTSFGNTSLDLLILPSPIVIDADELVRQPEVILPKYFQALMLPWDDKYLNWDASDQVAKTWRGAVEHIEWGKTNKVFEKAFESSCFQKKPRNLHLL